MRHPRTRRHRLAAKTRDTRVAGEVRWMLRGLSAGAARPESGEPPDRFKIANWGLDTFRGGAVLANEEGVAEIRRRMAAHRQDRVRIDIAHKTAFKKAAEINPEDILGYADLESVPGDGLYLCNAAWTPNGRKLWQALPDPSPAFLARQRDHLMVQLDSVGLCPDGELELPTLCAADASVPAATYLQSVTPQAMKQVLIALLKKAGVTVPDQGDMTDAEYEAALTAAAADYTAGNADAAPEVEKEVSMELSAMNQRLKKLEADATAAAAAAERAGKEEIRRLCSAEGKVLPFTDDQLFGTGGETAVALSAVQAVYKNLVPTVPGKTAARTGDKPDAKETKHELSADERRCFDLMGVTPEEVEKFAPVAAA